MREIKFKEKYKVGVEQLDREHEELFVCLNKASIACQNGDKASFASLLDSFVETAQIHFSHEEEYMEAIAHPDTESFREEHCIFERTLVDRIRSYHENCDADLLIFEIETLLLLTISFDKQILALPPLDSK